MKRPSHKIDITVKRGTGFSCSHAWMRETVKAVLSAEKIAESVSLDILITNDRQIRRMNKKYRGIDRPTDILSFALNEKNELDIDFPPEQDGVNNLGEIIISYPRVTEQSDEHGVTVEDEFTLLITHGILHLLGYNHEDDSDARKMRRREKAIISRIKQEKERK
jgi:probable rRNA maturation factor